MADLLLKASTVGYLRNYGDLIGLSSTSLSVTDPVTGKSRMLSIAGVVEDSEAAIYAHPLAVAQYRLTRLPFSLALPVTAGYQKELTAGNLVVWSDGSIDRKSVV